MVPLVQPSNPHPDNCMNIHLMGFALIQTVPVSTLYVTLLYLKAFREHFEII